MRSVSNLVSPNLGWGSGSGLYASISAYFLRAYTKHMLTIVVPEGTGIGSAGYLRIIEVCDREITYIKRRQSVRESDIEMLMLP